MITLRLGSSWFAALLLVPALAGVLICAFLAVQLGSLLAALCAAVSALVALRLGWILLRRRTQDRDEVVVTAGRGGAAISPDVFMSYARHSQGLWNQEGVVMVADHGGIFLPMGFARHLLVGLVLAPFVPTVRFADVSFDIGGSSPEAMRLAVERHGGFELGPDWTWNQMGWLTRLPADGVVVIQGAPAERMGVFTPAPGLTAVENNRAAAKALVGGVLVSLLLLGVGVVGAQLTGIRDVLVGFGSFAGLIMVAVVLAAVAIKQRPTA